MEKEYRKIWLGRVLVIAMPVISLCLFLVITIFLVVDLVNNKLEIRNLILAVFFYIYPLVILFFHKYLFAMFVIDSLGIALKYKRKELRRIRWAELVEVNDYGYLEFRSAHGKDYLRRHTIRYTVPKKLLNEIGEVLTFYRKEFAQASVKIREDRLKYFDIEQQKGVSNNETV